MVSFSASVNARDAKRQFYSLGEGDVQSARGLERMFRISLAPVHDAGLAA